MVNNFLKDKINRGVVIDFSNCMSFRWIRSISHTNSWHDFILISCCFGIGVTLSAFLFNIFDFFGVLRFPALAFLSISTGNCILTSMYNNQDHVDSNDLEIPEIIDADNFYEIMENVGLESSSGTPILISQDKDKIILKKNGSTISGIKSKREQLSEALNLNLGDIEKQGNENVVIKIIRDDIPKVVPMEFPDNKFYMGKDAYGWVTADPLDWPHLFIAGVTGKGKSVFMKYLADRFLTLLNADVYIAAFKTPKDFNSFKARKNCYVQKDVIQFTNTLQKMEEHRQNVENGKVSRKEIFIIIDEAGLAVVADEEDESFNRKLIIKMIQTGRSAGIHFVIGTQLVATTGSPVSTSIRNNIPTRICFKVKYAGESRILFGDDRAFELPETKGRCIYEDPDGNIREIQTPFYKG